MSVFDLLPDSKKQLPATIVKVKTKKKKTNQKVAKRGSPTQKKQPPAPNDYAEALRPHLLMISEQMGTCFEQNEDISELNLQITGNGEAKLLNTESKCLSRMFKSYPFPPHQQKVINVTIPLSIRSVYQ